MAVPHIIAARTTTGSGNSIFTRCLARCFDRLVDDIPEVFLESFLSPKRDQAAISAP
jgi:hypothetical protein